MKLVPTDYRRHSRQILREPGKAEIVIDGKPYKASLLDYSLEGFGFTTEEDAIKRLERTEYSDVELQWAKDHFRGKIRHVRSRDGKALVGLNIKNEQALKEISFTSEDPGWDLIDNPETIANLFSDLAFKGPECPIHFRQLKGESVLAATKVKDGAILVCEILSTKRGALEPEKGHARFEIFQTSHAFETRILSVGEKIVELEIPKEVARLLRRETVRVNNGANGKNLKIRLRSQLLNSYHEVELVDYAEHGVGIIDPSGLFLTPLSFKLDEIEITTSDNQVIKGQGIVRGYRWFAERNEYVVGIRFDTASDKDRTLWHNVILESRYPALSLTYSDSDHEQIWALFEQSGYLDEKPREAFTDVFDVTKKTWKKLSEIGTEFSKRVMIRRENIVVGHVQIDRIYPDTWCIHHLAIDPKISKLVAKDLYSVTTDIVPVENAKFLISYTNSSKAWNQRNYYDFVEQYRYKNHNDLHTYEVYQVDFSTKLPNKTPTDLFIGDASKYDLTRIARYFQIHSNSLEREALALSLDVIDLSVMNERLGPFGLERKRKFIIAKRDNELLGFARIELGCTGVNIFGLFESVFIHVLPSASSEFHEIQENLLRASLEVLRSLNHTTIFVALENGRRETLAAMGVSYLTKGVRWILRLEALRRYQSFTQMLFGHLLLKKTRIHLHR